MLGPLTRNMTPTLDTALLYVVHRDRVTTTSSRAGADLGRSSDCMQLIENNFLKKKNKNTTLAHSADISSSAEKRSHNFRFFLDDLPDFRFLFKNPC